MPGKKKIINQILGAQGNQDNSRKIKNSLDLLCLLEKNQGEILAFRPSQPGACPHLETPAWTGLYRVCTDWPACWQGHAGRLAQGPGRTDPTTDPRHAGLHPGVTGGMLHQPPLESPSILPVSCIAPGLSMMTFFRTLPGSV